MATGLTNNVKPEAELLVLFQAIAQASPLPMVGLESSAHVVRYVNRAFCTLIDKKPEELLGKVFAGLGPAAEGCLSLLDRVHRSGEAETCTGRERSTPQSAHWSYAMWPVFSSEGRQLGIILQVIEETVLHKDAIAANETLTLSLIRQQELTEAAELLNTQLQTQISARAKAEEALIQSEKLASVGRMAAVISHEINNPLAAVTDLLYLARTIEGTPAQVIEYLDTADDELRRIAHICRQTMGFYRESVLPATFTVRALLDSVLDLLKAKIKAKQAVVVRQCDEQLQITATFGELRQVFSNFLVNSLDAMAPGGTVTLRASQSQNPLGRGSRIRISVADNGQGMSASTISRLWEPFFTTKGSVGNGLGLWVSRQIIDKHDGFVQVHSRTNGQYRGTVFSVVLPTGIEAVHKES